MSDASPARAIEVDELIRHIDRLWHGETSHAMMSMTERTLALMVTILRCMQETEATIRRVLSRSSIH